MDFCCSALRFLRFAQQVRKPAGQHFDSTLFSFSFQEELEIHPEAEALENLSSYISAAEEFSFSVYHFINFFDVEGYVLHVIAAFNTAVGIYGFGNCAGAQGHDGLFFLHDEDVVNTIVALCGIAYIFKIAGHVLLAVEIKIGRAHV